ncbi:MAG TPA: SDR family NAD(P)-dependent oxidoreductase, partial [Thermoanaerobaculia bacterium]|nr:SDR family NAD(P)-dependent oxidoreductase [Thermoanaerobaculia bacterium]
AAVNGPELCAVSGPTSAVEAFGATLAKQGVRAQAIHAAAAFHSAMMEPILGEFAAAVSGVSLARPTVPYVSNVTGTWMRAEDSVDRTYWSRHMRQTVRFWDGLSEITRDSDAVLLEVGPGNTLASLARQASTSEQPLQILSTLRHARDEQEDAAVLQASIGRLWLAGVPVDWTGYHGRERRRRVPLPTYPFERQRHWIEPAPRSEKPQARFRPDEKLSDIGEWTYVPSWRRGAVSAPGPDAPVGPWLLFGDNYGLGTAIAARLTQCGARVTTVVKGKEFSRIDPGQLVLNPDSREDYQRLVRELKTAGSFPLRILHLWSVALDDERPDSPETLADGQASGFYSLVYLAQALAENAIHESVSIGVVVNGLYEVSGERVFRPERSTVFGPSIVIPQEYPNVASRMIDVVLPTTARDSDLLADEIIGELDHPLETAVVAYRGRYRWVQDVEAVRLEAAPARATLRPGGVYVVTGGLGGVGLVFAKHLAERVAARLVLVGRGELPPRSEWASWLEGHETADATATKLRAILALEEAGAEVLALSADVADRDGMARVLAEARRRFGGIHGVVHAAGIPGYGIIQLKTREITESVMSSKVSGTRALWQLLRDDDLDFVFLCSSIASVVVGPGQADYRGANAYLDAFARSQRGGNGKARVLSVNWDVWQEVGMAVTAVPPLAREASREAREREIAKGILPAEGIQIFERVLASDFSEVIVSTRELRQRMSLARELPTDTDAEEQPQPAPGVPAPVPPDPSASRTGLSTAFVEPATESARTIAKIWEQLLGIATIGDRDDFFEAGGDSLLATQVMSRLYRRFQVDVPLRTLFETRTLAAFAARVEEMVSVASADREEIEV